MKKYDSYKDSGVEWIGEIPNSWELVKVKNLFKFNKGSGISKSDLEEDGLSECILYGELFTRFKEFNVIPTEFSKTNLVDKVVSEGDELLIPGSTTTTSVDLCNCKTLNHSGIQLGGDIIILKPHKKDIRNEYYSYFISNVSKPDFEIGGRGVTIHHIYPKHIREIHTVSLPISEQQQIVSYLDRKTSQIDSLIEKTKRKIELLKEKRTSLINELVTKGLNPNVEMKDSGVEWIGEIPSHWGECKIKHISETISKGTTPSTIGREILDEGTIYYIKIDDFVGNTVNIPKKFIDKETHKLLERSSLQENDILVVITGSTTGKTVILSKDCTPSNTNQNISFVRLKNKEKVKYTWYWLISEKIQIQVGKMFNVSTLPSLSMEDLGNFQIPQPPLSEQNEIVSYLDEHTQLIDKTVSIEEKRIELLKEYRQSLISEVVTGKIDVRVN